MLLVLWLGCNATPPSGKDTPDTGHADSGGDSGAHDTDSGSGDSDSDTGGDSAPVDSGDSDSGGDSGGSSARTIEVCGDGTGDYVDLPEAVAAADWGDTIELCPGTYTSPGYVDHYVSIIGTGGSANTVIRSCGDSCGAVLGFDTYQTDAPVSTSIEISGVTLDAAWTDNAGLYVWSLPSLATTVSDMVITGIETIEPASWFRVDGGAGELVVDGTTVVDNLVDTGYDGDEFDWGAFHVSVGTFDIAHVIIADNGAAYQDVVSLSAYTAGDSFRSSIIVGNSGLHIDGLIMSWVDATISNVTVVDNDVAGAALMQGYADFRNMVVASNTANILATGDETYSLYSDNTGYDTDVPAGTGDLYVDPLFTDPASGDYTLQPASPAIDAGDPDAAYNDADGSRNDMGAFGGPDGDWSPSW